MPPITVLYQDADLVVVNKPAGISVHRGWSTDRSTVASLLRDQLGLSVVHPVHRLDRGTSGILIVALNPTTAAQLALTFRDRQVEKRYLALVRGTFKDSCLVDHPVPKAPGEPRVEAQTYFEPLARAATQPRETSLVLARPLSGRTHQIRRHLKHLNHPIIGDVNYGKGPLNRAARSRYDLHRLALHALDIELVHPTTGKPLLVHAALPDDLRQPLIAMGYEEVLS